MSEPLRMVAIDLGASSGRVALGTIQDERLRLEPLHRFENVTVSVQGRLYWDVLYIWRQILYGLGKAAEKGEIASVGVDSWAVDYALLDAKGHLLDGVRAYRDPRTEGVLERATSKMSKEEIYRRTGIQFMPINTLDQLLAAQEQAPELLGHAELLLTVPDLFHSWLSGRQVCEATNASTTQFLNPETRTWDRELLGKLGLPTGLLPDIVPPGTVLGPLTEEVREATGLKDAQVIAPATHDTASAVAAVPAEGDNWAYLSSGTWSLLGLERPMALRTEAARAANLTNEVGVNGTIRLLKNVMGLWILQECARAWDINIPELVGNLSVEPSFSHLINPDDSRFLVPGPDMPARVQAFCRETEQLVPEGAEAITRCVLESLALKYSLVMDQLRDIASTAIDTLYVVGGGSQNRLLSQWTADACGCIVYCGPAEATLFGNLLVQAQALGAITAEQIRPVVRRSAVLESYYPSAFDWTEARQTFLALLPEA